MIEIILFILVTICIVIMIISYIKIDISKYNIESEKIDKNLKIMLLSDLHNRNIKNKLVKIISDEDPDIIVLCGDMVNNYPCGSKNFINMLDIFKNYKTFYTYGNHEEEITHKNRINYSKKICKTNIILLNNLKSNLTINIKLFGLCSEELEYVEMKDRNVNYNYINDRIGSINKNNYNILIAHNPIDADAYEHYGFDLVLSGHIHGGIIILPKLGGVFSPEYRFFPKYYRGLYTLKKMKLIVSRGLGFSKRLPFRMFNPAEVVIINLMKKK